MRITNAKQNVESRMVAASLRGLATLAASFVALLGVVGNPATSRGVDLVRYWEKNAQGVVEERTAQGETLGVDPNGVAMNCESEDVAPDENPIPSERVLWVQYDAAPMELSAARVETEVGNYEEALEKLKSIAPEDVDPDSMPLIAAEAAWYKAYSTLNLALLGAGDLKEGGAEMTRFVQQYPTSYHYYEGCRLLGDAFYAYAQSAAKDSSAFIKRAEGAYGSLLKADSDSVKACGKLGLGRLALAADDVEKAKTYFQEVVDMDAFDVEKSEARIGLARATSKEGDHAGALALLNALLAETPDDATLRHARIYNAIGDVSVAADRLQEAAVAYLHVDLLYPQARTERVAALKALVGVWKELGREDRAIETERRLRERFHVQP